MTEGLERVAMVLLHRDGGVLIQHRDAAPGTPFGGLWGLFGGHLEAGESGEDAARREIEEELGLRLDGALEFVAHRIDADRERFFFAAPLAVSPSELTLTEGQGMALVPHDELDAYPLIPIHRAVIGDYFSGPRTAAREQNSEVPR